MFQLTAAAAAMLADIRHQNGIPDEAGVRASSAQEADGGVGVALAFTEAPADGDLVIEQEGTSLFVAPELVKPLDDRALDVADTEDGPRLLLRQAGTAEPG